MAVPSLSLFPSQADRYTVLLDLARTLAAKLDPATLYAEIHAHVSRALPTSSFHIAVLGPGGSHDVVFSSTPDEPAAQPDSAEIDHLAAGDFVLCHGPGGVGSRLAAPLLREQRLLGYLVAGRHEGAPFDVADAHFLLAVGALAGVALDNARLFAEARQRGEEAERLEAIAQELGASLEVGEVMDRIAQCAFELVDRPVVLWMLDGERIRAVARAGDTLIRVGEERVLPAAALARQKADSGAVAELVRAPVPRVGLPHPEGRTPVPSPVMEGGRLLVPLLLGERLLGILAVGPWEGENPDLGRVRLLHRMAPHAASALENARLHAEVLRLSLTDPLVQLPNRRQLDLFLEKEFEAARRGRPLAFVLYDLDRFKEYNDAYGHRAGDVALIRFADILRRETRAMNLAARYGGEEFATVLSGTNEAGGFAYAERVRRHVLHEFGGTLSVSAGVAAYSPETETPIDLVVAADRALYRAKLDGRNRVYVAGR